MTEQEVKLKGVIADYLEGNLLSRGFRVTVGEATDNIYRLFEQAGYVQLDEDQDTPVCPKWAGCGEHIDMASRCVYLIAQQDMLNSGFRRIRRE